mgnify:CR=1 FL=1
MKPYQEAVLYLKSLIVILESLEEKDTKKDYIKINIGILNDVQTTVGKLIANLHKMDK